jgi:hypothetical protein
VIPVVVIDVLPPEAAGAYAPPMVEACTRALRAGHCALAASTEESTRPEAIAIVAWQGTDWQTASVRVRHRDRPWATRYLSFSTEDPIEDRWTAVGFTIATLVDELSAPPLPTADSSVRPKPAPASPVASARHQVERSLDRTERDAPRLELAIAVGALTGTGWTGGDWQRGGVAMFRVGRSDLPFVAIARASYGLSNGPELLGVDLRTRWYTLSVGLGVQTAIDALNARLVAAVELARREAMAASSERIGSDAGVRAELRAQLSWPLRGSFGLVVGGTMGFPGVNSGASDDNRRLREPNVSTEMLVALEVRL